MSISPSAKGHLWVVSRRLAKSYIRISCASVYGFGATTDIHQAPGHAHVIGPVLLGMADSVEKLGTYKTMAWKGEISERRVLWNWFSHL